MSAAEKLEHVRETCAQIGVPLDMLNSLAVDSRKAGQLLDVSEKTIRRLIHTGELHAFKIGSNTRIELAELVDFMERNRIRDIVSDTPLRRARALEALDG